MTRRISKRLYEMEQSGVRPSGSFKDDWRSPPEIPSRLLSAKVIRRRGGNVLVQLQGGSEEWIKSNYWGILSAMRAGVDPVPPVGGHLDVMVHGYCPWKRDGGLRVDIHHWQKDEKYCNYESGYRSKYDAENGLFAVPPWEINKENK